MKLLVYFIEKKKNVRTQVLHRNALYTGEQSRLSPNVAKQSLHCTVNFRIQKEKKTNKKKKRCGIKLRPKEIIGEPDFCAECVFVTVSCSVF